MIPVDSGEVRILLDPGSGDTPGVEQSCWSRDSRTIYVAGHHANGTAGIWAVPLAGGTPSLLVRFDESGNRFHRPNLDCDDKRFYMIVEERQSDVTVVEMLAR